MSWPRPGLWRDVRRPVCGADEGSSRPTTGRQRADEAGRRTFIGARCVPQEKIRRGRRVADVTSSEADVTSSVADVTSSVAALTSSPTDVASSAADVWPTSGRRTDIRRPHVGVRRGNVQFDVVPTEALRRPDVGTTNTKIDIHRGPTSALRRLAYGETTNTAVSFEAAAK